MKHTWSPFVQHQYGGESGWVHVVRSGELVLFADVPQWYFTLKGGRNGWFDTMMHFLTSGETHYDSFAEAWDKALQWCEQANERELVIQTVVELTV